MRRVTGDGAGLLRRLGQGAMGAREELESREERGFHDRGRWRRWIRAQEGFGGPV